MTCTTSSNIAGTQVTSSSSPIRMASFPAMYSARVKGFDR